MPTSQGGVPEALALHPLVLTPGVELSWGAPGERGPGANRLKTAAGAVAILHWPQHLSTARDPARAALPRFRLADAHASHGRPRLSSEHRLSGRGPAS
jgi:hypothetical protein